MRTPLHEARREFLAGTGVAAGAPLAGCTDRLSLGQDDADDEGTGGDGDALVIATVDQRELQAIQMELQQQVQAGEIDQEEAAEEAQRRQEELVGEALDELVADVEDAGLSITVDDRHPRFGAVEASGDAADLIAAMDLDSVSGLGPTSDLEALTDDGQSDGDDQSEDE